MTLRLTQPEPVKVLTRADMVPENHEKEIAIHGCRFLWEQAIRCPCSQVTTVPGPFPVVTNDGEPRADCPGCHGKGFLYHSPQEVRAVALSAMNKPEIFQAYGVNAMGAIRLTLHKWHIPNLFDRFTMLDGIHTVQEVRTRKAASNVTVGSIPLGAYVPSPAVASVNGTLTFTPSGAPALGQSFTALVSGTDAGTGLAATETVTWAAGVATPKTTLKTWSAVSGVTFAATFGAPTFTLLARSTVERTRFPIEPTTLQVGSLADPKVVETVTRSVIHAQRATPEGVYVPTALAEGTDFRMTASKRIDWAPGDALGTSPAIGARYSLTYYALPRYIAREMPFIHRQAWVKRKGPAELKRLPTRVDCWLDQLGDAEGEP